MLINGAKPNAYICIYDTKNMNDYKHKIKK